jgi:Zn-dependent protease with chaperone function
VHDADQKFTQAGFIRAYVVPALLSFAIPILGYGVGAYADGSRDRHYREVLAVRIARLPALAPDARSRLTAVAREQPLSQVCADGTAGGDRLPAPVLGRACRDYAQLRWLRRASLTSGALGVAAVVVMLACAGLAFRSYAWQYASFVAGWQFLRVAGAVQVVVQGGIAVLASYWLTAVLTGRHRGQVVGVVGLFVLYGAVAVVRAVFRRIDDDPPIDGEPIARGRAPALWARIDALCVRLGTAPLDHVVAGIDDNFFVTEHPRQVGGRLLRGRLLFVSLSLLKRLDKGEADAILAHEVTHFSGGDTAFSTRLAPQVDRFRAYTEALHDSYLSRPVFHVMLCYWSLFQLALNRTSRARELRADRIAAELTSPAAVANALYKVAAYSAYRARVERDLFDVDRGHADLDIASRVAAGFADYARGPHLKADLAAARFPHPFDSHPPLAARLQAIGVQPRRSGIVESIATAAGSTWFDEIDGAAALEAAQWSAYEARFQDAHATSLAYRYLPATPEERAHVERHFPTVEFAGKEGGIVGTMDCLQIHYRDWAVPVRWDDVVKVGLNENSFTGKVVAFKVDIAGRGTETVKLPLRKLAGTDEEILGRIGSYYDRYLNAKAYREQAA